jgi:hypothetical protein
MSAPNMRLATSVFGKTATLAVTTSPTAIVENTAGSGKVLKVSTLTVANVDGLNACTVTVDLYRSATATRIGLEVNITSGCSYAPIERGNTIYLEEGDALRLTAENNSDLEAVCSYEEIS